MATNTVGIKITAQDNTAGAVRSAQAGLQSLQGAAGGVNRALASIGVGLSVGAFVAYTKSIIDGIDALNDLKDATGASIENISALEDVARRSGASLDTVGTSLVKLNQALSAAKPGSATEAAVKAIGLSVKDLKALDPAEAFRRIAVGLEGFADDANKARLVQELFGKSLKEVAPLLKDLATQGTLNATVTTAQAEAAEKFNKQLFSLQTNVNTAARALIQELIPAISATATEFSNGIKYAGGFLDAVTLIGTTNPFRSVSGQIAVYREEVDDLTASIERYKRSNSDTRALEQALKAAQQRLEYFKALQRAEIDGANSVGAGAGRGGVNPAFVEGRDSAPDITGVDGKKPAGISAAQKLINDGLALYSDLMAEASGYSKTYTEDVTKLAAAYQATSMTAAQYTAALAAINAAQPGAVQAEKDRLDAAKLNNQAVDELFDAQEKLRLANEDQIKTGRTMLEQIEYETRLLGLSAKQRAMATLERELETQGIVKGTQAYDAYIVKLREATAIKAAKEVGIESANELAQANRKAAEESSKYWEDALMRAFESGKGFFESLWDTIKNTLKTQVLKVLVTGSMTGVSALASAATGGASDSVLGYVNGASNLNTLYGAGSQLLFGGAAGASTASLVGANAVGAMGGDALGSLIALNGGWAGVATGTTAAGAAGTEALAGMSATGYGVIVAAAIAAIMYITSRGETRMGATYVTGPDGKAIKSEGPSGGEIAGDLSRSIFDSTQSSINATLAAVGSQAVITGFTAGLESSENGKGFAFAGGMVNGVGVGEYKGRNGGQFTMSDMTPQQAMEAYVSQMNQVTLEALQAATDVPALIANELKGIDIGKLTAAEVGELTKNVQTVIASVNVFNDSLKTLPFESLWNLSFKAAAGLVDAAGGFDKLNESLSGFYENFYSDAEQTTNLTRVLGTGFTKLGLSMPTDNLREWYRAKVEGAMALDQSIPANQAYLASILSMQGGVDKLADSAETAAQRIIDAAKRLEAEIVSAQDSAMQEYMSAQAEYASIIAAEQESAAQAMQDAAEAIQAAMASAGQGIVQLIQSLLNTPTNAAANYRNDLALAQQGDVEASKRLPTSGRAYLDTQINSSANAYEAARATARMVQELNALPAVKSYEQQLLEAVGGTTSAVGGTTDAIKNMNSKITAELSVTARSEILKLINFVANTDLLPDDLKAIALADAGTFSKTISFIQGSNLTAENMQLALMTETEVVKTYNFVAGSELNADQKQQAFGVLTDADRTVSVVTGSMLSDDAKQQAFDAVQDVTRTVSIVADSTALAEYKTIALDVTADATKQIRLAATGFSSADAQVITAASSSVTKTVAVALGNNDPWALAIATAQSGTIDKVLKASGGVLTPEQQMLLNGITNYEKNISIGITIDRSELTELQQQLMTTFGTLNISEIASAGLDLSSVISEGAAARLQSVAQYVSNLTWTGDRTHDNANLWSVYDAATAYGVSQVDLANAASFYNPGLTYARLLQMFDDAGIPRFAMGTNYLPSDMLAQVHQGERIIPAADNRELMSRLQDPQQNSEALVAEVRALRDDNAAQARAMVQLQQRLTKLMERWDSNGMPDTRLEV